MVLSDISKIVAVWAKIVAVFRKKNWGGFWQVWAVSDFKVLKTLYLIFARIFGPDIWPKIIGPQTPGIDIVEKREEMKSIVIKNGRK